MIQPKKWGSKWIIVLLVCIWVPIACSLAIAGDDKIKFAVISDHRDQFWSILVDNDVQAFFCGHSHHLSVIQNQGVYQIDTGEIHADHLSITIVEVDSHKAIARLYETDGSLPEPNSNDNVFNSNLDSTDTGDEAYTIVFRSDFKSEKDPWWGCYIETAWGF